MQNPSAALGCCVFARGPRAARHWSCVFLVVSSLCGCQIDEPQPIAAPGSDRPVDQLSQLGIFLGESREQLPRSDFVPYDVNVSLYSDGAEKQRFAYVPPGTSIHVTSDRWEIPVGAYFVKTFYFPRDARDPSAGRRLIETRFLIRQTDGYLASTYLWNDEQSDATVSGGNLNVPVTWIDENGEGHQVDYHVPGTSQCVSCHQGRALGMRTRQMDHDGAYADGSTNQIDRLVGLGLLDGVPDQRDPLVATLGKAPLDQRARDYLDANCSHCHGDGGSAAGTHLYWDREHTQAADLPLCRATSSVNGSDRVLVPGHPEQSEFLARMLSSDPFVRMPRGPVHVPDAAAIGVLSQWVRAMMPPGCP